MTQQYIIPSIPLDAEGLRRAVNEYRKYTGASSSKSFIVTCSDKNLFYLTSPPDCDEVPDAKIKLKGFSKVVNIRFLAIPHEFIGENWWVTGNKWDQVGKVVVIGRIMQ